MTSSKLFSLWQIQLMKKQLFMFLIYHTDEVAVELMSLGNLIIHIVISTETLHLMGASNDILLEDIASLLVILAAFF